MKLQFHFGDVMRRRATWLVVLSGAVVLAESLSANMRGPQYRIDTAGTQLYRPAGDLVARSEELDFECASAPSGPATCAVRATYHIESPSALKTRLRFVVSTTAGPLNVNVNGRSVDTEEKRVPRGSEPYGTTRRPPPIDVPFEAALIKGKNTISITYAQVMGFIEQDYSGCYPCWVPDQGRFVYSTSYELWPLREWTLASDFQLKLRVSLAHKRPGLPTRLFRKSKKLIILGAKKTDDKSDTENDREPTFVSVGKQEAENIVFEKTWGSDFPDVLNIAHGDEDLLKREK